MATKMTDPKDPAGDRFPEFHRDHETRIKALEDALALFDRQHYKRIVALEDAIAQIFVFLRSK
jgi:hypothetical protein